MATAWVSLVNLSIVFGTFFVVFASATSLEQENQAQTSVLLDVAAVLQSLNQNATTQDKQQEQQHQNDGEMRIVHRNHEELGNLESLSHKEQVRARLQRDESRVEYIKAKVEMTMNDIKQSDLLHPVGKNSAGKEYVQKSGGSGSPITSGLSLGSGEYFVRIGVGYPPKFMYLVLDTGSDVPWIQCSPCKSCYKQYDAIYNPKKSSTFKQIPCSSSYCKQLEIKGCAASRCLYQVAYGDGSFTVGELAQETFQLGSVTSSSPIAFGCGHDNEGLFVGAAGLLGLGAGKLSFPSQIGDARKFSYCLVSRDNSAKASSALVFGDSPTVNYAFTPLLKNPRLQTFYYAGLSGISVGGILLSIPPSIFRLSASGSGGVIIDSGTSVTRLPTTAYNAMRDAFRAGTRQLPAAPSFSLFDTCYDFTALNSVSVPTLALHFEGGTKVQLPPNNYMVPVDNSGTFCFAFAKSSLDLSIIGNIQQQTMRVAFDLENSRIGFAPNQCS